MFAGVLLANDSGGYPLAMSLCKDAAVGRYAGAVVCSMMGVTMTFTIPFAFSTVKTPEARRALSRGLLIGIATIPVGCIVSGLLAGLPGRRAVCEPSAAARVRGGAAVLPAALPERQHPRDERLWKAAQRVPDSDADSRRRRPPASGTAFQREADAVFGESGHRGRPSASCSRARFRC